MGQTVFNNFEIADMDFWRGEAYTAFFNYLDRNGGFYYQVCPSPLLVDMNRADPTDFFFVYEQRWGDAPVHAIGASLFGAKDGVHFFREIGYEHYPFTHCPQGDMWERGRCSCEQERNFGMWKDNVVVAQMRLLIFLCLDYHGGWSCLPKWEQAFDQHHEQ